MRRGRGGEEGGMEARESNGGVGQRRSRAKRDKKGDGKTLREHVCALCSVHCPSCCHDATWYLTVVFPL